MSEGFNDPAGNFGDQPAQPPRKKSSAGKIILILAGVGGVFLLLCCGGIGAMSWFGLSQVGNVVAQQVQDDPAIQEHIGEIQSSSFNMMATGELAEETGEQGVIVLDVTGSKGSGKLRARMEGENVTQATLVLPDGQEFELSP